MFNDSLNKINEKYCYENFYLITAHIYSSYSLEKVNFNINIILNQPLFSKVTRRKNPTRTLKG